MNKFKETFEQALMKSLGKFISFTLFGVFIFYDIKNFFTTEKDKHDI